jgi:site-specific DNA-cytosine methylase
MKFYWDQDLTETDSFAGAGGLSYGLERAGAVTAIRR